MRNSSYLIPVVVIAIAGILSSIFIVDEREKVLVLRFGQIKQLFLECIKLSTPSPIQRN